MANIITGFRIVCALVLIFCPTFSRWFYILYISGGISDVFDGVVARHLGKETKLGAHLDTIADFLFILVVLVKVLNVIHVPKWIIIWCISIAILKITGVVRGFVISKQFISEHTAMNKICGILLFLIPLCIGRFQLQSVSILIILTCVMATIAAIQEGYLIYKGKQVD